MIISVTISYLEERVLECMKDFDGNFRNYFDSEIESNDVNVNLVIQLFSTLVIFIPIHVSHYPSHKYNFLKLYTSSVVKITRVICVVCKFRLREVLQTIFDILGSTNFSK